MNARQIAANVLTRVWTDGAYAAAALSSELSKSLLDVRDRGLATELTYGVLRTQGYLERRLGEFGKLKLSDHALLAHLLVAAYQLEFLDRIPGRAAVHEAVESVSALRGSRVAGFSNAILRKLSQALPETRLSLKDATLSCAPSWLKKRLVRDVGEAGACSLLAPSLSFSPTIRVVGEPSSALTEWLGHSCRAYEHVPGAYRYEAGGDPRSHPSFTEGAFVVQELGAQLVTRALGVQPGDAVLDVCAGRGQKTSLLAELVGPQGRVVATDVHEHKVRALGDEMKRVGASVTSRLADLTQPLPQDLLGVFDRVLVDAPCTGLGTLSRRPEIARRLKPEDPARMADLQAKILRNAVAALRPGGVLLYATCSVLREESEDVLLAVTNGDSGLPLLEPVAPETTVDRALFHGESPRSAHVRLLPESHGTDGYFLARLKKA